MQPPPEERPDIRFTIPCWFSQDELRSRRAANQRSFDRGYRQIAIADGETTFPTFKSCCSVGLDIALSVTALWPKFTGVDLSSKKRPGNAIHTIGVNPQTGLRIPVDVRAGAWTSPQVAQQLLAVHRMFQPRIILVENNGYQEALREWTELALRDESQQLILPLDSFTTGANKHSDQTGLPSMEAEYTNRMWQIYLPHRDLACNCPWCVWYDEMMYHPGGETSDHVMAHWFSREAAIRGGASGLADLQDVQADLGTTIAHQALDLFDDHDDLSW